MPQAPALLCASCDRPLRRLRTVRSLHAVHPWVCDGCKSTAAELGSLADSVPAERLARLEKQLALAKPGDRKCPQCRAPMKRAAVSGGYGSIDVDGCGACKLAWFDHGELNALRATTDRGGTIPQPSAMTSEQRAAWRIQHLRNEGLLTEEDSTAAIIGLVLGIPMPERVRGQERAVSTWTLAVATAVTSIFAFGRLSEAVERWGMIPDEVRAGSWTGLLTCFFVHADPFHLAGNLVFLLVFGSRVEALAGHVRMLIVILAATALGSLVHAAFAPDQTIPLIGASGGISGVIATYVTLRPGSKVRMMIFFRLFSLPAAVFLLFWIALQAIGTAMQMTGVSAVSALAHLGGAAAGILLGLSWRGLARERMQAAAAA
jgi:membrane associated rhomboid family serine protease/Zn-finger nucleic acid-binding protein